VNRINDPFPHGPPDQSPATVLSQEPREVNEVLSAWIAAGVRVGVFALSPADAAGLIHSLDPTAVPGGHTHPSPSDLKGPARSGTQRKWGVPRARLPLRPNEGERKAIFAAVVGSQDDGFSVEMARSLVAHRFKVSEAEVGAAEDEGIANDWPPLED
jgi:hypothetical protein